MSARKAEYIAEQKGGEPENRVQALIALAPHFPETRKLELLDDIRTLPDGRNRAQALVRLAEHLGSADERRAVLSEARSSAFDFQKPEDAAAVLASLLPLSLDDQDRTSLAYDALEIAKRIDRPATRASLLAELAPFLLPEDVSQTWAHAIDAARSENDAIPRCGAILNIALRLPKKHPKRKLLARDTIANAESTITNADRNGVHFDLIGSMAIKNWASALAFLSNIETDPNRRAILSNEAELTARRAPEGYFRVEALTAIISYLPEPQRTEVFEDTVRLARTLPTGNNRTHALVRLAALASPDRRQDVVVEAIEASRLIEDEYGRFLALLISQHYT